MVDPQKIEVVKCWIFVTDIMDHSSFYHNTVKNFSSITTYLIRPTQKEVLFILSRKGKETLKVKVSFDHNSHP